MTKYLQNILRELLESTESKSKPLSGGAVLHWIPKARTLAATRLNRGLESRPSSEQATFEREIRIAGYAHGKGESISAQTRQGEHIGIQWTISKAKPKQSKTALKREAQGSLF